MSLSTRTFVRKFRAHVGQTPATWVARARVLAARRLLETTTLSIDRVAESVGFGAAVVLRQHFARTLKTTPLAYRQAFSGGAPRAPARRRPTRARAR